MSEEFLALRVQARQRRDAAIEAAREEYEATLTQIQTLQDRLGKQVPRAKRVLLAAAIDSVLPQTHEFTVPDIIRALEVRYPKHVWLVNSVNTRIATLRKRGIIERLIRPKMGISAVYVVKGVKSSIRPADDWTLVDAIKHVLTKPMTIAEIVVAILEAGYRTTMPAAAFRTVVSKTLVDKGYRRAGGKWAIA